MLEAMVIATAIIFGVACLGIIFVGSLKIAINTRMPVALLVGIFWVILLWGALSAAYYYSEVLPRTQLEESE